MVAASLPTWGVVFVTALIDSINPCAIGVLVLLISTLLAMFHDRARMLLTGIIYIIAVYITYFLAGLGLITFFNFVPAGFAHILTIIVATIIIIGGLLEIKDFFWYGQGFSLSIPVKYSKKLPEMVKHTTTWGTIVLGIFVAGVELPCTGGPYLAITYILSKILNVRTLFSNSQNVTAVFMLLVYNLIFVMPLVLILAAVYFGTNIKAVKKWREKNRKWLRLIIGIILLGLGILLFTYA